METTQKTIILFSTDPDRVIAGVLIPHGAAPMGPEVQIFYTVSALKLLRKPEQVHSTGKHTNQKM